MADEPIPLFFDNSLIEEKTCLEIQELTRFGGTACSICVGL